MPRPGAGLAKKLCALRSTDKREEPLGPLPVGPAAQRGRGREARRLISAHSPSLCSPPSSFPPLHGLRTTTLPHASVIKEMRLSYSTMLSILRIPIPDLGRGVAPLGRLMRRVDSLEKTLMLGTGFHRCRRTRGSWKLPRAGWRALGEFFTTAPPGRP